MVPTTLPTYVSKAPAVRRTVQTIDLDSTGVWSSGRNDDRLRPRPRGRGVRARRPQAAPTSARLRLLTPSTPSGSDERRAARLAAWPPSPCPSPAPSRSRVEEAFDRVLRAPAARALPPPATRDPADQGSPRPGRASGGRSARRAPSSLADGGIMLETLTSHDRPHSFGYTIAQVRAR